MPRTDPPVSAAGAGKHVPAEWQAAIGGEVCPRAQGSDGRGYVGPGISTPWALAQPVPGPAVLSRFVLELVAHTHDLAVSTDKRQPLDQRLAQAAHQVAGGLVPPAPRGTDGSFADPVPAPSGADAYVCLAAFLGRVPR